MYVLIILICNNMCNNMCNMYVLMCNMCNNDINDNEILLLLLLMWK